jgi:hypothetical protein
MACLSRWHADPHLRPTVSAFNAMPSTIIPVQQPVHGWTACAERSHRQRLVCAALGELQNVAVERGYGHEHGPACWSDRHILKCERSKQHLADHLHVAWQDATKTCAAGGRHDVGWTSDCAVAPLSSR